MSSGRVLKDPTEIIAALDMLLREQEDKDEDYLNKDIRVLRERVLYTHSRAEICMETLITNKTGNSTDMTPFYKRLSFSEKMDLSTELKSLEPSLLNDLVKLNKARNDLAHPKKDKVEKYKQREVYMQTLACCIRCLMGFSVEFKRRLGSIKKTTSMV